MRNLRPLAVACALLAVVGLSVIAMVLILRSKDPGQSAGYVATAVGLIGTAGAAFRYVWKLRRDQTPTWSPAELTTAADGLASALVTQWRTEASARGLTLPSPARVKWEWSPQGIDVRQKDAETGPPPGLGPAPIPGVAARSSEELLTAGTIDRLHEIYASTHGSRLTILGGPGSGKTAAAILLLLHALDHRSSRPDKIAGVPVPVLLTLAEWNPHEETLTEWASQRLFRDYPVLTQLSEGRELARELLQSGQVSLFLDGLDEMDTDRRPSALKRIEELPGTRTVVLTRPDEYLAAALESKRRVVIELLPVDPQSAADYLCSGHSAGERAQWIQVSNEITTHPDGVLARAMSTPLMLNLARAAFPAGGAPTELLPSSSDLSIEVYENLLLDRFIHSAYTGEHGKTPLYTHAQARQWLGYLAFQMRDRSSRDLYWWQLPDWFNAWKIGIVLGFGMFLAIFPVLRLGEWMLGGFNGFSLRDMIWDAALMMPAALGIGLVLALGGFGVFVMGLSKTHHPRDRSRVSLLAHDLRVILLVICLAIVTAILDRISPYFGASFVSIFFNPFTQSVAILLITLAFRISGFTVGRPIAFRIGWPTRVDLAGGILIGAAVGVIVGAIDLFFFSALELGYYNKTYELFIQPAQFLATGAAGGVLVGLFSGFVRAGSSQFTWSTPARLLRADLRSAELAASGFALGSWLIFAFFSHGIDIWLLVFAAFWLYIWLVLGLGASQAGRLGAAGAILGFQRAGPVRIMRFLEDARAREVLRQAGPAFQFRHAKLQDKLANEYASSTVRNPAHFDAIGPGQRE